VDSVRYATADGHHLAYRVCTGAPGREVVLFTPGGTIPMEYLERDRIGARLLDGLLALGSLVQFDRRGIGLSDPITDWSRPIVDQWADDLAAIVDAACTTRPVVVSLGDYWGPARLFAGRRPDALTALVMWEPQGPVDAASLTASVTARVHTDPNPPNEYDWIGRVVPSRADDQAFREWFEAAGRTGASPAVASRLYERPPDELVQMLEAAQGLITVPTLVLRQPANLLGSPPEPDPVVSAIAGAQRADLTGRDFHWLGEGVDELIAEISRFVTGEFVLPAPERTLCAVLMTDIVRSTEQAASVGDARWKAKLDRHDAAIGEEVRRAGGTIANTTGDGVLATLPSADGALRAAVRIRDRLAPDGLAVRIGIHVGDVERRGHDLAGIAVHIAARAMAAAGPGEILVTAPVPPAVLGTAHAFEPAGEHSLKGVPGAWTLYRHVP
jgi:class 3 adenylate cyclase